MVLRGSFHLNLDQILPRFEYLSLEMAIISMHPKLKFVDLWRLKAFHTLSFHAISLWEFCFLLLLSQAQMLLQGTMSTFLVMGIQRVCSIIINQDHCLLFFHLVLFCLFTNGFFAGVFMKESDVLHSLSMQLTTLAR